jgi:hypothetical protein
VVLVTDVADADRHLNLHKTWITSEVPAKRHLTIRQRMSGGKCVSLFGTISRRRAASDRIVMSIRG